MLTNNNTHAGEQSAGDAPQSLSPGELEEKSRAEREGQVYCVACRKAFKPTVYSGHLTGKKRTTFFFSPHSISFTRAQRTYSGHLTGKKRTAFFALAHVLVNCTFTFVHAHIHTPCLHIKSLWEVSARGQIYCVACCKTYFYILCICHCLLRSFDWLKSLFFAHTHAHISMCKHDLYLQCTHAPARTPLLLQKYHQKNETLATS